MSDYDTKEGIAGYLRSLTTLNVLSKLRNAAYKRKERLNEFCVLGRFYFDNSGSCGPITDNAPADLYRVNKYDEESRCPPVMTRDELTLFMRGESFTWAHAWPFPPAYAKCSVCDQPWTIDNCHDIVTGDEHTYVSLEPFVGIFFAKVKQLPEFAERRWHVIHDEIVINPARPGESDGKCSNGNPWWRIKASDYVIQTGDIASVQLKTFTHDACYRRDGATRQRAKFKEVFANAGLHDVSLITVPNEYWPKEKSGRQPHYAAPWYLAQVGDLPPFKLGWRKSVISIDWSESGLRMRDEVFASEDVTKSATGIHAHGYAKASEYLAKLVAEFKAVEAVERKESR